MKNLEKCQEHHEYINDIMPTDFDQSNEEKIIFPTTSFT